MITFRPPHDAPGSDLAPPHDAPATLVDVELTPKEEIAKQPLKQPTGDATERTLQAVAL